MEHDRPRRPSLRAEELFAEFVLRRDRGEAVELEELCAARPELAEDLRRLHADWTALETACGPTAGGSLVRTMLIRDEAEGATPGATARGLFCDFLLERGSGSERDLEELCREHPALADELRALHERWRSFEETIATTEGLSGAVDETLLLRHGRDALTDAAWEAARSDLLVERLLRSRGSGHTYSLCGEVARGGMGAILKVWDPNLRRNLAMKVIHEGHRPSDLREESSSVDNVLARFLEEAQVTGQLDHPGIVPVYELGVDEGGRCYFTMRLVRGRDLLAIYELVWAEREGWTTTRALTVLLDVCDAVGYAHSKQVLHRDLKPANVMVGRFGETYVMDWGLARVMGREETHDLRLATDETQLSLVQTDRVGDGSGAGGDELRTMDGDVIGTPAYMAPEQARGSLSEIGPQTDVYAIGAMLYHLLARQAPYVDATTRRSGREILAEVLAGPPAPLEELEPRPPAELVAICEKAMARAPRDRYANVKELGDDLRAFLEGRVVRAYRTGPAAEFNKWVGRNRVVAGTVLSTVGLVVAGLAALSANFAGDAKVAEQREQVAVEDKNEAIAEKLLIEEQKREIEEQKRIADEQRRLAVAAADEATRERSKVLRLSDAKRLEELEARADELWPAVPALVPQLERWLVPAERLSSGLEGHRAELDELRRAARRSTRDELARDLANHPRAEELRRVRDRLAELTLARAEAEEDGLDTDEVAELDLERALVQAEHDALEEELRAFRVWRFDDPERQWHHDLLAGLVRDLEAFSAPETGAIASVRRRIELADRIRTQTVEAYAERWSRALASIADPAECPAYGGLELEPQVGLVPLARDERSGLWEFVHVATGSVPEPDEAGRFELDESSGIVLVLLPGGPARLGAQPPSRELDLIASDPNVHDSAWADEGPIHELVLAPFFVAKHELTQAQWLRATGAAPARYGPIEKTAGQSRDLTHPVESVTWTEADRTLWRLGLLLPTEAQWEYAARAGSPSPWWCAGRVTELSGKVNLADRFARENGGPESWPFDTRLFDGYLVHAPVVAFEPNAFGLHGVAGNVSEWCRDGYVPSYASYTPAPGDGYRDVPAPDKRVARGGSFRDEADELRSAFRHRFSPDDRRNFLGVRAARALDRP